VGQLEDETDDGARRPARRGRGDWRTAAVLSTTTAVLIGFWVWVVFDTLVVWTPLAFLMQWYHGVLIICLSALGVTAVSWWSIRKRRCWFLCIPAILGWLILSLLLLSSFKPLDSYQEFVLDCATVEVGESVDVFVERMNQRGLGPPEYWDQAPSGFRVVAFRRGGAAISAYFDEATRKIVRWRFVHD